MSIPTLIVGGSLEERRRQIDLTPNPDLLLVAPEKSIGIKEMRQLQKFLQKKPYQKEVKTVVIDQAETMTLPAQQAILKTLEEPPAHSQIFLLASHEFQLLETIVSRCRVKKLDDAGLSDNELKTQSKIYRELSQAQSAGRFLIVSAYAANKDSAKEFVNKQLYYFQDQLRKNPETVKVKLGSALNTALSALKVNVNPKLTLEVLSLKY